MRRKIKHEKQPKNEDSSVFDIDKIKPYLKKILRKRSYIVITIITAFLLVGGAAMGAFYYKDSKLIKKAEQLIEEAKYEDAIGALSNFPKYSLLFQRAQTKIEESKRKIVEGELSGEKVAREEAESEAQQQAVKRSEAEAKAQQEKFEKELKSKQLADKEVEEKMMNADNDGDGLTYREELKLGTSDWNTDSDGDGIPDKEDLHPAGGGRYLAQNFKWEYKGNAWEWTYSIHEDWYEYYKNKPRLSHGSAYITYNDPAIKAIAQELKSTAESEGYHKTSFVLSFIQGLPYVEDYRTGYDDLPKYPVETMVDRNGDCEDTSYLAASIISAMNINCVLVLLPGHMAVGIWIDSNQPGIYYEWDGRRYYYFETTAEGWQLGDIPDQYRYATATLLNVSSGATFDTYPQYKKPCDYFSDIPGYYFDGNNFYSDSQCNNIVYCLQYKDLYYGPLDKSFYWDSVCSQLVVKGCTKDTNYPAYFTNGIEYYYDSRCTQKARVCRLSSLYYDRYWDGSNFYWDSNCTQGVVAGCYKSSVYPGYFFDGLYWYSDYQCTQKAKPN